jgi:hypothetical protein
MLCSLSQLSFQMLLQGCQAVVYPSACCAHLVMLLTYDRAATPTTPPHDTYEFTDSRQAEILARCCRVWVTRDVLDPESVHLAEAVLKVWH